jgi:hypothetical protein
MKGITVEQIKNTRPEGATGAFTQFLDETFYKISHYDAMPAFFMTIVSSSDVWNYLWSNGGLTAGRIDCDHALFPYATSDKVSDGRTYTGPYTAIKAHVNNAVYRCRTRNMERRAKHLQERERIKSLFRGDKQKPRTYLPIRLDVQRRIRPCPACPDRQQHGNNAKNRYA